MTEAIPEPPAKRRFPLWKKLAFATVPLIAVLALVELGFRLFAPGEQEDITKRWRFLQEFHPFLGIDRRPQGRKVLDDEHGKRTFTVNNIGFRGQDVQARKPAGVFRIACLGGSTTENEFVDDSQTYCAILQRLLREQTGRRDVEVVNAGCATYSTAHSFINYALRVSDLQPDLVTIYHGINDLVPGMCPGFRSDYRNFYRFYHLVGALQTDLELRIETPLDRVLRWSVAYRFCTRAVARSMVSQVREPRSFKVQPANRVTGEGPRIFERNLRAIITLAQANGSRVLLCTFPYVLRPDMTPAERGRLGGYGWFKFLTVRGVIDGLQRHNVIIERLAKEKGTLLADLATAVPKDFEHFFDSCHMTPEGQAVAARELTRVIMQSEVIGKQASRPTGPK